MITLKKADFEKILAHAKKELPNEACGLIAGVKDGADKHIQKVGIKQLMAGGGVALIGTTLVPLLAGLF